MEYLTQSRYPWEKDAEWGREVGGNSCWRETHIITTSARSWTHFSCDTTQIQGIMPWCSKWCKVNVKQHLSVFGPLFAQRCFTLSPPLWVAMPKGCQPRVTALISVVWSWWKGPVPALCQKLSSLELFEFPSPGQSAAQCLIAQRGQCAVCLWNGALEA